MRVSVYPGYVARAKAYRHTCGMAGGLGECTIQGRDGVERIDPDEIRTGPKLDKLRANHPNFIENRLEFGPDLSVSNTNLSRDYADWIEVDNWSSWDMHNLYALIRSMGAQEDEATKTFHGVGLRK